MAHHEAAPPAKPGGLQLPGPLAPYSKSVAAFLGAFVSALLALYVVSGRLTLAEFAQAAGAGLGALGVTFVAPRNRPGG